jgi:hypothetical protein
MNKNVALLLSTLAVALPVFAQAPAGDKASQLAAGLAGKQFDGNIMSNRPSNTDGQICGTVKSVKGASVSMELKYMRSTACPGPYLVTGEFRADGMLYINRDIQTELCKASELKFSPVSGGIFKGNGGSVLAFKDKSTGCPGK